MTALDLDPFAGEPFDTLEVAGRRGALQPPTVDHDGRLHFTWPTAEVTVAPAGATGWCDVALVVARRLVSRRLPLDTEEAAILAWRIRRLSHSRDERHRFAAWRHARLIERALEDPGRIGELDVAAAGEPPNGWPVPAVLTDMLHPWALARMFPLAEIVEHADGYVGVVHLAGGVGFATGSRDERVRVDRLYPDGRYSDESTDLLPAGALLVMSIDEALTQVREAEDGIPGIDAAIPACVRADLFALERAVLAGLDPLTGYERLTRLFDPNGWPGTTTPALAQITAIARVAGDRWLARAGRPSLDRAVELARVSAAAGREVEHVDDRHRLRGTRGELDFRTEGDLVTGHGRVIGVDGSLVTARLALSAHTLEWVAWAFGVIDAVGGRPARAATELVVRALVDPLLRVDEAALPVVQALGRRAARRGAQGRATAHEILQRQPQD